MEQDRNEKTAIISFTSNGLKLAEKIAENLKSRLNGSLKYERKYSSDPNEGITDQDNYREDNIVLINKDTVDGKIRSKMKDIFSEFDRIIFISSTGIAVRFIAPYIKSKTEDPAVLVIDDMGKYVISLLSGHIGGANEFASEIAAIIGATPVITTASDGRNIDAVDTFAMRHDLVIDSMEMAKNITHMMVENKKIRLLFEVFGSMFDLKYDNLIIDKIKSSKDEKNTVKDDKMTVDSESKHMTGLQIDVKDGKNTVKVEEMTDETENSRGVSVNEIENSEFEGNIIITNRLYSDKELRKMSSGKPYVILRPKNLFLGIGCRRGTEYMKIRELIERVLSDNGYSLESVNRFGSIDIKQNEEGLIKLSEEMSWPFEVFSKEELLEYENLFEGSEFVKKTVGVAAVSETAAYAFSKNIVIDKVAENGITITVSEKIE